MSSALTSEHPAQADENTSQRLAELTPLILDLWEEQVRLLLPASRGHDPPLLRDHLPVFLLELAHVLSPHSSHEEVCAVSDVCQQHGRERAWMESYSLDQVLREYSLLRQVIVVILEGEAALSLEERQCIHRSIDGAMEQAGSEFARVHQEALRRSEKQLRLRAEELAAADQRKNEFLAMLAHELRTPIGALTNALYILENLELPDERGVRQLGMVNRQTRQLARLVEDLLDMTRITQGKVDLRREKVDLVRVAREAAQTSLQVVEARGQELTLSLPPEPVWVEADPARLEQVFTNLLNNAAKFTEAGGRIWLVVEVGARGRGPGAGEDGGSPPTPDPRPLTPGEAIIRVRDTGMGIEPVMLPHIFDLFTQVDPGGTRSREGLGVGLTLVRRLVEMHGGSVTAHSSGLGQGSEFILRLPLCQ
jgi:signal transduction histidine kinase